MPSGKMQQPLNQALRTEALSTEVKQQLDWRRSKVLELPSQGYSERKIAETLQINDTAVHRDLVYLRQQTSTRKPSETYP